MSRVKCPRNFEKSLNSKKAVLLSFSVMLHQTATAYFSYRREHLRSVSHLNYCFLVGSSTTETNVNKIEMLQKKAVRCTANVDCLAHTETLFTRFNISPIYTMYE